MTLRILAFGVAKEIVGGRSVTLELNETPTIAALSDMLQIRYPQLKALASYRLAVNNEFASATDVLHEKDEIAIIPPVSGG